MMLTSSTTNPYYARILLAAKINKVCGGTVIAPWQVDGLSDDWLDAFRAFAGQNAAYQAAQARLQKSKNDWLQRFKHYGYH